MILRRAFAVFFVSALVVTPSVVGETRNAGIVQERPAAATRDAPGIGPPNGALVIVGGAMRDPAILAYRRWTA